MTRLIKLAASSIIIAIAVAGIATAIALSIYYLSAYTAQYTAIERFPGPDAISVQMLGAAGDIVVDNRAGYSFKAVFMVYAYNGSSSPGAYFGRSISIAPGTNIVRITDIVPPGFTPDFKRSYMVIGRLAIPIAGGLSSSQPPQDQGVSESRYVANSYSFGSKTIGDVRISQYWSSLSISSPNYKVEGSYPRRTSFCDLLTREITRREGTRATGDLYSADCVWCCKEWGTCCTIRPDGTEICFTCCISSGETPYSYPTGEHPSTTPAVSDYRDYFCTNYYFGYYNDILASVSGSYSSQDISISVIRGAEYGQRDERRATIYPSTSSSKTLVVYSNNIYPYTQTMYTWQYWYYWVTSRLYTYYIGSGGCPNCVLIPRTTTVYDEHSSLIAQEIRYGCAGYLYGTDDCRYVLDISDQGSYIEYYVYPTPDGRAEGIVNITIKLGVTTYRDPYALSNMLSLYLRAGFDIIGGSAIYEVSLPKLPKPPTLLGGGYINIYLQNYTVVIDGKRENIDIYISTSDFSRGYVPLSPISLAQGNIETYTGSYQLGTASVRMTIYIQKPWAGIGGEPPRPSQGGGGSGGGGGGGWQPGCWCYPIWLPGGDIDVICCCPNGTCLAGNNQGRSISSSLSFSSLSFQAAGSGSHTIEIKISLRFTITPVAELSSQ
ncbi:MAG: hypothetical protein QXE01_03905 [Sulfolobales archaeon]